MTDDPHPSPALEIDLTEASPLWRSSLADVERLCEESARAALAAGNGPRGAAELSIVLGDDALVRELNRAWRGQDRPTNVLSFPALPAPGEAPPPEAPALLGDVVLAFETVQAEALAQGKPLAHHLRHLLVHGVLHLLGFDHESAAEAEIMEGLEIAVLARLGVPDPYRLAEASHG
jgi:probable rRNA maturation factor